MGKPENPSTNQEQKKGRKRSKKAKLDQELSNSLARFDRDTLIIHCITMKFSEAEALAYLKSRGHEIKKTQYYEDKRRLDELVVRKAYKLAAENGLIEQHMHRIEQLETIEREHWQNYHEEKNPLRKSIILEKISTLQPYISSAYDYIKEIIKEQAGVQQRLTKAGQTVITPPAKV